MDKLKFINAKESVTQWIKESEKNFKDM